MGNWASLYRHLLYLAVLSVAVLNLNCAKDDGPAPTPTIPEAEFCSNPISYTGGITVTGSAIYYYRPVTVAGLGSPLSKPIRYAEVQVVDSNGSFVQCSSTDGTGNISLSLPANSSNLTLKVNSRIANSHGYASVLNDPTNNAVYSLIVQGFSTSSSALDIGTLSAAVDTPGGAFNILDRIVDATDYLTTNVNSTQCATYNCIPFPNNKKVQAYWVLGKNPAEYFGSDSSLSFYVPGSNKLYILGGKNGNYTTLDTDHYDNSVILHEYAHFLEDNYSRSDSPGGTHSADRTIDARLAWGEGWANFFQGAVLDNSKYRDTIGNPDGTTSLLINYSLELQSGGNPINGIAVDIPAEAGEGNFREFSITRFLWDALDDNSESGDDVNSAPFAEIWTVVSGANFLSSNVYFRNVGLFHELHNALTTKSTLDSLYTLHKHDNDQGEYGVGLTPGTCAARDLGTSDGAVSGDPYAANHFSSNDFFRYTHSGGSLQVRIDYSTDATTPVDLDLYVYKSNYAFGDPDSVIIYSEESHSTGSSGSETASGNVPAGVYMINVQQYKFVSGKKASYTLMINGVQQCPSY